MTDALAITGLTKAFGGTLALDDVSLTIREGEVHGLLGENGSGKSTLIKILAGYHAPDAGALEVRGNPVELPLQPGQFRSLGIEFVHQDLGLIPSMSVLENLYIGELVRSTDRFRIRWGTRRRAARAVFERYGLSLDPSATVDQLEPVQRALLAIVRAIEGVRETPNSIQPDHRLLVLDEPTVFLPRDGIEHLFALMRAIAAAGSSLLFVSHDLDEVLEITDRVTVLRNGRSVGTVVTSDVTDARLVEMIVGRDVVRTEAREPDRHDRGSVALSVKGLSGSITRDVSFTLHEGETLGLTGLEGSGCEEIPYLLFGARPSAGGTVTINRQTLETRELTPPRALRLGLGLISGDRKSNGSVESLPAVDNVTLQVVDQYFRRFILRRGAMRSDARRLMTELDVRPLEPGLLYGSFSGGNQQKLLLGKWLQANPHVLLLHEPTQGVDIGAREQIFRLLQAATAAGAAVLCASTDYEQLVRICTRVLVFGRGRVVRELVGTEVTKERIADEAYNSVNLSERVLVGGN